MITMVLIAGIGVGGWLFANRRSEQPARTEHETLQNVVQKAQQLSYQKQHQQAADELLRFIDQNQEPASRYEAMVQLGSVYINGGEYAKAREWFQKAQSAKGAPTIETALGLALAAEKTGDKEAAIAAYRQAVQMLKQTENRRYAKEDVQMYEAKIRSLGGSL